jgi:hypothetical protein
LDSDYFFGAAIMDESELALNAISYFLIGGILSAV